MAAKQFYDDTPIETSDVQRWEDAADEVVYVEKRAKQYAKNYTDEQLSSHATDEKAHMDIRSDIDGGISVHNKSADAHENRFSVIRSLVNEKAPVEYVNEAFNSHNADMDAHGGIRNTIALLQKYPCYEYNTSGGNVQRFDDVSVIPHNIGITVHGATNGVINPTVRVYGKNLLPISGWDEKVNMALDYHVIAGVTYTFSIYATYSSKTTGLYGFSLKIQESGNDIVAKGGATINNRISVTFTATESGTLYYNGYNTISCKELQLEVGGTATEYEPYKGEQTVTLTTSLPDGVYITIDTFTSVSPNMTVIESNYNDVVNQVDVKYNRDGVKYYTANDSIANAVIEALKLTGTYIVGIGQTDIANGAYAENSDVKVVSIADSLTRVNGSAFYKCPNLTSVTIPDSVTRIEAYAFLGCPISKLSLGNGLQYIGTQSFQGIKISSITIPDSVTTIGQWGFNGCTSLETVVIGSGVTTIEHQAFNGCTSLTAVTIPSNVTSIASGTFNNCKALTDVTLGSDFNASLNVSWGSFTADVMVAMFNALKDLTGETAKTLTLGSTNIAKLTDEQKAIATDKNWNLA